MKHINNSTNIFWIFNSVSKDTSFEMGLSGGDRIIIELTKIWMKKFRNYTILTCNSGLQIIKNYIKDYKSIRIENIETPSEYYENIVLLYLFKLIKGVYFSITHKLPDNTILLSSSDFLPDVIPAFLAKMRNRNITWAAAFYFFAANPLSKAFPYKGFKSKLRGIAYYTTQKIAYFFIKNFSDFTIACNEIDHKIFIRDGYNSNKIWPIYGGVDLSIPNSIKEPKKKIYDGVFMARFHPQKGPLEAVRAWQQVLKEKPHAKMAMIGNGPLYREVSAYIKGKKLKKNIVLLGFMDGVEKYKILKSARIFLHTSVYETGGMAAAEGMAAGLPVVAFDHDGFDYCYPKGMIRIAPIGNTQKMARTILDLLVDEKKYNTVKKEALDLVKEWDWSKRASVLLAKIQSSL